MIKMTPQLRFPEFTDEWKIERLGQIVSFHRGGALSKDQLDNDGQYKAIHYGELFTKYNEVIKEVRSKTNTNTGKISESGDLLMPTSDVTPEGLAKASAIYESGVMLGGDINVLRPNRIIDSTYLSYLINSQKKKVMRLVTGTTVRHVYASDIAKIYYGYPSLDEQQKIADFLTAVDDKISALKQKTEKLKAYRRGVMKKIFSQQIRFKDGSGEVYPEWEEKKLGEVARFSKGAGISKTDIVESGKTPAVRYGELYTKYGEIIDDTYSYTNLPMQGLILSEPNDVIIPASGETHIDIATASCVLRAGIALSGDINIIRSNTNSVFLAYYLNNAKKHDIAKLAQGVSVVHLYNSNLKELRISLPNLEEQQKIADFLSALDDKINLEEAKLASANKFKKALLQKMFV